MDVAPLDLQASSDLGAKNEPRKLRFQRSAIEVNRGAINDQFQDVPECLTHWLADMVARAFWCEVS